MCAKESSCTGKVCCFFFLLAVKCNVIYFSISLSVCTTEVMFFVKNMHLQVYNVLRTSEAETVLLVQTIMRGKTFHSHPLLFPIKSLQYLNSY